MAVTLVPGIPCYLQDANTRFRHRCYSWADTVEGQIMCLRETDGAMRLAVLVPSFQASSAAGKILLASGASLSLWGLIILATSQLLG